MNLLRYKPDFEKIKKSNLLVGLTGGIGSGKTTALSFFSKYGCYTVCADEKVRDVLTDKKICAKILKRYSNVSNQAGNLDKKKLASLIFNNNRGRTFIERLIHPEVILRILDDIRKISGNVIVVEIPLLFESRMEVFFDVVVSVIADKEIRIKRLIDRGMRKNDIRRRISIQKDDEFRIENSDVILYNNNSINELEYQVQLLSSSFKKLI